MGGWWIASLGRFHGQRLVRRGSQRMGPGAPFKALPWMKSGGHPYFLPWTIRTLAPPASSPRPPAEPQMQFAVLTADVSAIMIYQNA